MEIVRIQSEFGWVVLAQIATAFTLQSLGGDVMKARKKYKVDYPKMYAEGDSAEAKAFNCVQRGHQNALEIYPSFLFLNVIAGLKYPIPAALLALSWSLGRVLYMKGYSTGDPEKRYSKGGAISYIGLIGSLGLSVSVALSLLGFL